MNHESARLTSFTGKWSSCVTPRALASAGFFLLDDKKKCTMCAFCHNVLARWECYDSPLEEHAKFFPFCPLIIGTETNNVPLANVWDDPATDRIAAFVLDALKKTGI